MNQLQTFHFFDALSGKPHQIGTRRHNTQALFHRIFDVIGIGVGAFIAAKLFDDFKIQKIPTMWEQHFGSSLGKRGAFAFIGGSIAMFGARLADGCPSGHGLSGVSQLAVSGIVALAMFFLGGLIGTYFLYGRGTK